MMGPYKPGVEPTKKQELIVKGARMLDANMSHAVSAYEGSVRLLTFQGGEPLPWSSMVLARTAFEATLRVIWILEPGASDDVLLSRIGATTFEGLEEHRKLHEVFPDGFAPKVRALRENEEARQLFQQALEESGLSLTFSKDGKRGAVETPDGQKASFPFNVTEASTKWWKPVGVHTYRWLCSFTHAAFVPPANTPVPVSALEEADAYVVLKVITDSVWKAMDAYSSWVGMPNSLVRRKLDRVDALLESRIPAHQKIERPPTEMEGIFLTVASTLEDSGLASRKMIDRFVKRYVRRLGHKPE
jgi:hypothetical protein